MIKSTAQFYAIIAFYIVLILVILIYICIFCKFWSQQKRFRKIKRLHSREENSISFFRKVCLFRRLVTESQLAINDNNNMQILKISYQNCEDFRVSLRDRKRHSSSVLRNIKTLTSYTRAAKYILILVLVLLISWTPWFSYILSKTILDQTENSSYSESMNHTLILNCVNSVMQERPCFLEIEAENLQDVERNVKKIIDLDQDNSITIVLGVFLSTMNSLANPVLYAIWYPEFRQEFSKLFRFQSMIRCIAMSA